MGRGDAPNSQHVQHGVSESAAAEKTKDGDCSRLTSLASPRFFLEGLLGRLSEIPPLISSLQASANYTLTLGNWAINLAWLPEDEWLRLTT